MTTVPNRFPTQPSARRLAIIGEAPGADEERLGRPFVGASGRFLAALLGRAGHQLDACFLGNVSQHRPPGNKFELFKWTGPEVQSGLAQLRHDINTYNPNLVLLLGNPALRAAKEPTNPGKARFSNREWRGSLFICEDPASPFLGRKCVSSYHPAYTLRDYATAPLLQFDLRRAVKHSASAEWVPPVRDIEIASTVPQVLAFFASVKASKCWGGADIEGYPWAMSCFGFADSPSHALVVPFFRRDGSRCWPVREELVLLRAIADYLEDPALPKVWMNGLYDRFVNHYSYGICPQGNVWDVMLSHWEMYADLAGEDKDKRRRKTLALALQASIYTEEPFYKTERESLDDETFFRYNGKDCCVTLEIALKHREMLSGPSESYSAVEAAKVRDHLAFNNDLLKPLLYMMNRGIRYDADAAAHRQATLRTALLQEQARFNALTGHTLPWSSGLDAIRAIAEAKMLTVKRDRPYKDEIENWDRFRSLINAPGPDLATIGELENLLGVSLNVESNKQFQAYLYETLALPVQYNEDAEGNPRPTSDYEALLRLAKVCQQAPNDPRLAVISGAILLRSLGTRVEMLGMRTDRDKRIRCSLNPVGSSTGRVVARTSVTGSGGNLQTIPNYTHPDEAPGGIVGDRDLFVADPDHWIFALDGRGADGLTVAAYSAMLGDSTMLDDYKAGLKPYYIITLMLRGVSVDYRDRAAIADACKGLSKTDWDAFACKRVQHGASYLEGGVTISRNILKDSEGKLWMSASECDKLKGFFMTRYWGIPRWHDWVARRLKERSVLVAASGQVRRFFGRPDEILTKAVAFEPQANTTYATNLGLSRLYNDPENKRSQNGSRVALRAEPLLQVHDELVGQFPKCDTSWAVGKIKSWFDNELLVAGQRIVIPFDGGFGPSWGQLTEGKI